MWKNDMFEWLDFRNRDSDPQALQYLSVIENLQITVVNAGVPRRVGFSNLDDRDVFGFIPTILGIIGRPVEPPRNEQVAYMSFLPPSGYLETAEGNRIPVLLAGWLCDLQYRDSSCPSAPFHPTFIVLVYCGDVVQDEPGTIGYSGWKWVYKPFPNLDGLVRDIIKNHNQMIARRLDAQERFSERLTKARGTPVLKHDPDQV